MTETTDFITIPKAVENLARLAAVSVDITGMDAESALNVAITATKNSALDVWRRYSGPSTFGEWVSENADWAMTLSVVYDANDGTTERPSVGNVRAAVLALIPTLVDAKPGTEVAEPR